MQSGRGPVAATRVFTAEMTTFLDGRVAVDFIAGFIASLNYGRH